MLFRTVIPVVQIAAFLALSSSCLCGPHARADVPDRSLLLWDSKEPDLAKWLNPTGLTCSVKDNRLVLNIQAPDSRITREGGLRLETSLADAFLIRYRATDFTVARTSGEIFYANRSHGFADGQYVTLPSLTLDGEWHDLFVRVGESFRGDIKDWIDNGPIAALRFDFVNEAPGCMEVASILFSAQLHPASDDAVTVDSPAWYFFATESLSHVADHRYERRIILPKGDYAVWAHVVDTPASGEFLAALEIPGANLALPLLGNAGYVWRELGTFSGSETTLRLSCTPSLFFDAMILAQGKTGPRDLPEPQPAPVHSTIKPAPEPGKPILRPYWPGLMIFYPGRMYAENARTFFRRAIEIPNDLQDAWIQVSVDDLFRLYINGERVAEQVDHSSWLTPTLLEVTRLLRKGEPNPIAVEAINLSSAGGMLFDLVMNRADHSCVRTVSDANWRCALEAPEGWTNPGFDDTSWVAPETRPAPPFAPWAAELPYVDKTWQAPTLCVAADFQMTQPPDGTGEATFRLQSEKPVAPGEVLLVTLTNAATGRAVIKREVTLAAENLEKTDERTTLIHGVSIPISRWCPSMSLRVDATIYGRDMTSSRGPALFQFENPQTAMPLESEVRQVNGTPQLFINGKAVYPMIGNGEGCEKTGTRESYRRAGFNIEAVWVDPMGAEQWWHGPDDYRFEGVDAKLIADLEYNPDVWMLPIMWSAPPSWWQDLHPEETAQFSDGKSWPYYKSTPSFDSAVWRRDAAAALTAFVKHVESMPYAARVVGYWIVGGVSAEWQGWGAHSSFENKRLMDYSKPAQEGFRRFLQDKYPARAADFVHVEIPPYSERLRGEIGVFRDPVKAQLSIDYNEYYSDSVADALLSCVRAAKDATGRKKIVGAYFGYLLEYANMGWCMQMGGHNALRKVLDSPDIDFLSAPPSYGIRRLGMPIGWMWPFRSIQTAGKLVWVDDDTRTFLSGECDYAPAVNLDQTQSMLRRNFGTALCRLCPQGFLQINSGRELDDPAIAADMRVLRRCGEYAVANNVARRAEIAVVVDADSMKYLAIDGESLPSGEVDRNIAWNGDVTLSPRKVNAVMGDLVSYQRDRIGRIGAPADWILFSDLPRREMNYKLYIMLDCFQYNDEELQAVRNKLYASSATVLWCYAPGFIHDGTADVRHMETLTGMALQMVDGPAPPRTNLVEFTTPFSDDSATGSSFGVDYALTPLFHVVDSDAKAIGLYQANGLVSLAAKRIDCAQVLFCGSNKISASLFRKMAEASGVHMYTDSLDPFEANDCFVMIHATRAGNKTLHLGQPEDFVDLLTGETSVSRDGNLTISMPEDTTRLFFTGAAERYLRFGR